MAAKRTVHLEEYFTTNTLAGECVRFARQHLPWESFRRFVEPSAGDGAFARLLPEDKRLCIDLHPRSPLVTEADFLQWPPPTDHGPVLTIGNPPFGQRAALAVRFLEKSCGFSDAVAFILPRSFRKHTFLNRVHPMFHLVAQFDCDDFRTPAGRPLSVRSVFQIWVRRDTPREPVVLPATDGDFHMKHFHISRTPPGVLEAARREYDFAIAQVGTNFRPKDPADVRAGSHWFIKARHPDVRAVFERLDFSFLDGMNTTFTSLSKKDIIQAYRTARATPG